MSTVQKEQLNQSTLIPESQDLRIVALDLSKNRAIENSPVFKDWEKLLQNDPTSTIQETPAYILQEMISSEIQDGLKSQLVLGYQNERLIASAVLIPKMVQASHLRGWRSKNQISGYRLAGNRISGDHSIEIQTALYRFILDQVRNSDAQYLLIDDLATDSVLDQIRKQPEFIGWKSISSTGLQDHHWLKFPGTAEEYWGQFKSKTRNTLRRKLKKMGEIQFTPVTESNQISKFLAEAHEVSKNTWQSQELGLRVENSEDEMIFLDFLSQKGWLRAYLLKQDSNPVAFIIGTQFNGTYYLDELGFDRKYSRLSPGTVLFHLLVNDLLENKSPQVLDFGLGDAEYKQLFGNKISKSQLLYILPPGWKSKFNYTGFHSYGFLKSSVKNLFSRVGAWKNIRRLIKDRVVKNNI